jgi:hypothetical protein
MRRFVRKGGPGRRVRVLLLLTVGAALLVAPSAGAGGQAGNSCPTGFDLGALTLDSALQLPRIAGGDTSGFSAFFNGIDKNGDGVICGKTNPAGNGSGAAKFQAQYNFVDNNSSATAG